MHTFIQRIHQSAAIRFGMLAIGVLVLYLMTAAPDVQAGDSAEFQLAAVVAGVPHPTTYPLYTILSGIGTRIIPFGNDAWRVTLLSVICGALMVATSSLLLERLSGSRSAGLIGALALGFSPGVWNAATIAEVYALLLLLMVGFAWTLARFTANPTQRNLAVVVLIGTLGSLYHGMFVLCAAPVGAVVVGWTWYQRGWQWRILPLLGVALIGMTPHLYPLIQFARFGPFNGEDYGLPTLYYWGAPQTWQDVFDLLSGGAVRRGIFQIPDAATALSMSLAIARRMLYEFGPVGISIGLIGAGALWRNHRRLWGISLLIGVPSFLYVLALGPTIGDWPAFTLPMLLTWGLWIAAGVRASMQYASRYRFREWNGSQFIILATLCLTVAWGGYRIRATDKHQLTLYRDFATAVHTQLAPQAVVITHWEQGMTLQYLRYAEGARPDVWIDVVEPGDDPWLARAERRYPDRPVYFIGHPESVSGIPVHRLLDADYADLYQLVRP